MTDDIDECIEFIAKTTFLQVAISQDRLYRVWSEEIKHEQDRISRNWPFEWTRKPTDQFDIEQFNFENDIAVFETMYRKDAWPYGWTQVTDATMKKLMNKTLKQKSLELPENHG